LGLGDVGLDNEIGSLDLPTQQKIEIARAIFRKPKVLLLDEPTSSLAARDVDWLGQILEKCKKTHVTVVFISHRLKEVREFCDQVTVLRNGEHIETGPITSYTDSDLIGMIAGRSLGHSFPARRAARENSASKVIALAHCSLGAKLSGVSLSLSAGEILGVAGLQGMGQLDLFLGLYGVKQFDRGSRVEVDGQEVVIASPRDAISSKIGIALVPEDRKTEGLFLKLSGRHNTSIPVISRFSQFGLINTRTERVAVEQAFRRVQIDPRAVWTRAGSFSGGNQQKIAIAKWILAESRVLLLYDPTRGIDVGTKNEIYSLMRSYVDQGGAILFYSTEIPELTHVADRVVVLYNGRIRSEICGEELTDEAVTRAVLGSSGEEQTLTAQKVQS
jgi:ribose transport system ATP-binding protein